LFTMDESVSMRKEAVIAIVWILSRRLSGGTEGNHNGLSHDNRQQIESRAEYPLNASSQFNNRISDKIVSYFDTGLLKILACSKAFAYLVLRLLLDNLLLLRHRSTEQHTWLFEPS
jgi:hypothetical protein